MCVCVCVYNACVCVCTACVCVCVYTACVCILRVCVYCMCMCILRVYVYILCVYVCVLRVCVCVYLQSVVRPLLVLVYQGLKCQSCPILRHLSCHSARTLLHVTVWNVVESVWGSSAGIRTRNFTYTTERGIFSARTPKCVFLLRPEPRL